MAATLVYITAPGRDEAARIGRAVVEARLAACANVIPGMTSFYWWQGALQEDQEAVLILKTRPDLVDALTAKVKELHGYQVPCVVALPIEKGNPDFLDWINEETCERP
ncbi:MAG: divalent-cation tolerance protein CutA [Magnetospirillum sp. WYHS-4]